MRIFGIDIPISEVVFPRELGQKRKLTKVLLGNNGGKAQFRLSRPRTTASIKDTVEVGLELLKLATTPHSLVERGSSSIDANLNVLDSPQWRTARRFLE